MNWLDIDYRLSVIKDIKSYENIQRKKESKTRQDIYTDRLKPYVVQYLTETLGTSSLEMPVVHCINAQKKVVNETSIIYNEAPKREFQNLSEEQKAVIQNNYKEMKVDTTLSKANIALNNHDQCWIQLIPSKGKYKLRLFKPYQIDAIPNDIDPEIADAIIISSHNQSYNYNTDSSNEQIGDEADYMATLERFVVWSNQYHFVMNGKGEFVGNAPYEQLIDESSGLATINTDLILNPIGKIPFVEIAREKDYKYFVTNGASLSDFTIQLNAMLSDVAQIVRMQGYAQAYLKGPAEALVDNMKVGPTYLLKLAKDQSGLGNDMEFGFANSNADIKGAFDVVVGLVSLFLSSEGISASAITASGQSENFKSGLDRLIAMFQKMDINRDDFNLFKEVEHELYELLIEWNNVLNKTDTLKPEYVCRDISEESDVQVIYKKPESIQSEKEKLETIQLKKELNLSSRITDYMDLHGVTRDQAIESLKQIDDDNQAEINQA